MVPLPELARGGLLRQQPRQILPREAPRLLHHLLRGALRDPETPAFAGAGKFRTGYGCLPLEQWREVLSGK